MAANDRTPKSWSELGIDVNLSGPTEQDTLCPKCSHTRKKSKARCLGVNLGTGYFYCHHCGAHGSQEHGWDGDGPDWRTKLQSPKPKEYQPPRPLPRQPEPKTGPAPLTEADKQWAIWVDRFAERGISEVTLRRNKIAVVEHYMRDANLGDGGTVWVAAYPYFDGGKHIHTKYRGVDSDGEKLFQADPGTRRVAYGIDDIGPETETAFVVEGENDKLAMEEGGIIAAISVPDGAPSINATNYDAKFAFMEGEQNLTERFPQVKNWVIAVDNDGPGRKLGAELARRFGPTKCWRVDWGIAKNPAIKDANDALRIWGKEKFKANLKRCTVRWPVEGMFNVQDLYEKLDDWYDHGPPKPLSTGWASLDPAFKIMTGTVSVFTGVPNIGKSTFLNALMVNAMMNHDFRVAICSPEWRPIENQIQAMMKTVVGKPFFPWHPDRMSKEEADWARRYLNERVSFILPDVPTIASVLERADIAMARTGIRGLIIDPWGEIETSHLKPHGISQTDWIGQNMRELRRYATSRDVWVALVVHPTKMEKEKESGEYPVIDLYDLSGSAQFANVADFCVSLWRSDLWDDGETEVWIKKSRFDWVAQRGACVKLWYDIATGRYSDRPDRMGGTGTLMPWEVEGTNIVQLDRKAGDD
jgi:twinkle protein